jgi:hypothetical protein
MDLEKWYDDVDWIPVAWDTVQCRSFVKTIMSLHLKG